MLLSGYERRIAVTGGAGFIGSNLLLRLVSKYPDYGFVNIDCLTYAGNLANLRQIERAPSYRFEKVDICDPASLRALFEKYAFTDVIHLAAETHVDRSIIGPAAFIQTNIVGTFNLLEMVRERSSKTGRMRFVYVSTDEVYGSDGESGRFVETSPFRPSSPYAASKAAADNLVSAYHRTYGVDTVVARCCNCYGPYQFPEKLIPLMILNSIAGKELPIYGDGQQIRDWLHVSDCCNVLDLLLHRGRVGTTYNVAANVELPNVELVTRLCRLIDREQGGGQTESLIKYVSDRPGHDRRYALDCSQLRDELGWSPGLSLDEGLMRTVKWYLENQDWLTACASGEYQKYYERMYADR
ncbi:MAG: dTDP-glucose 4,6-dehydratase [Candidatus Zixiibacteriota bacterium]